LKILRGIEARILVSWRIIMRVQVIHLRAMVERTVGTPEILDGCRTDRI
jgi:hypothetical protein